MQKTLLCIPNVSEGRNQTVIQAMVEAIQSVSTVTVVEVGDLNMTADGTAGGWKYDNVTGKFIMNHTSYDDR